MTFFGLYPTWKPNIGERIKIKCIHLERLLNQLEPQIIFVQHLGSLKQALFHSHTKVVQVTVKQFIRLANENHLAEQLTEDLEVVLGLIENLAHKDLRVARDCVKMLLMLSCSPKAIKNLLCPDIADVLKTIMTYVAVRILVYEFILQLSINSPIGLEKSYSCGILEDVINDFKNKESYLTTVHYHQLHSLAATSHGHSYLVKYAAVDAVPKQMPDVTKETMAHLVQVIPSDVNTGAVSAEDFPIKKENSRLCQENKQEQLNFMENTDDHLVRSASLLSVTTNPTKMPSPATDQGPSSIKDSGESSSSKVDKYFVSIRCSSPSSISSPSDSSTISRKQDDSSSHTDRSYTPPQDVYSASSHQLHFLALQKLVASLKGAAPHEVFSVYPDALEMVLRAIESSDRPTTLLALQVIGYVGSTVQGKRLLYKLNKKERFMSTVVRRILSAVRHSSADLGAQALHVFSTLISVGEASGKYEKITRKWFRHMGRPQEVLEMIVSLCQHPPLVTQEAAYHVLQALCSQEWGLHYIRGRRGLLDILLMDPDDDSRAIYQLKIAALESLLMAPSAGKLFKPQTLKQIHSYLLRFKNHFS